MLVSWLISRGVECSQWDPEVKGLEVDDVSIDKSLNCFILVCTLLGLFEVKGLATKATLTNHNSKTRHTHDGRVFSVGPRG